MKRFEFRLDKVLDARKIQEQQSQRHFAEAWNEKQRLERQKEDVESEIGLQENELLDYISGEFQVSEVLVRVNYNQNLHINAHDIETKVHESEERLEEKRSELTKAMQRRQVLESLRSRRLVEYRGEMGRLEQSELDNEAARRHYIRQKGN